MEIISVEEAKKGQGEKETPQERETLVGLFLDVGNLPFSPPSTVIDVSSEEIKIIRQGAIKIKE